MEPDFNPDESPEGAHRRSKVAAPLSALMIIQTALLLIPAYRDFVVIDELAHVPAGIAHWQTGRFHLYRVNPPLVRMLAALPALAARPRMDYQNFIPPVDKRGEWQFGRDFARANQGRYMDLIRLARLTIIAWTVFGTWVIFRWCRDLYGEAAGLVAATLWSFDPTVLAFGHFVVPDVPSATAGLAATYLFWRYLKRPSWGLAHAAGLLLGVAELTKFTLLILYAIWPLLWLVHRPWGRSPSDTRTPARALLGQAALIVGLSVLVINLGYGFRETCLPLGRYDFVSHALGDTGFERDIAEGRPGILTGNRFRETWLEGLPIPVPAEVLRGIDFQRLDFESGMPSYLNGQWRTEGWWEYYLYALAVKEPIGTWILVLWGLGMMLARHPASAPWRDECTLLLPAATVLAFVSSQTGFNHHMRYVLPIFPFLAVSTGKLAWYLRGATWRTGLLVLAALGWSVASSLAIYPHAMSYFNEAAGGPENGLRHLNDSNIEWGQDLLYLKSWLASHPEARPLGLVFNHLVNPSVEGIEFYIPPEGKPHDMPVDDEFAPGFGPWPGYYAVSIGALIGPKSWIPDGNWGIIPINYASQYSYFNYFKPVAKAGHSIYIYHILPGEADEVRRRLEMPPLPRDYAARFRGRHRPSHDLAGSKVF